MDTVSYVADLEKHADELKQVAEEHATIGIELRQKMCAQEEYVSKLKREIEERAAYEDEQRQEVYNLRQELSITRGKNHQLLRHTNQMRNCENCTMQGCHDKADKGLSSACENDGYSRWEFSKHQPLAYDLREELHDAHKVSKQQSQQIHTMRNCDNCDEQGCHGGVDESVGIACVNNDRDKWEFTP